MNPATRTQHRFARRREPAAPNMFKNYARCRNLRQRQIIHFAGIVTRRGANVRCLLAKKLQVQPHRRTGA
jgi:hypothetical protein